MRWFVVAAALALGACAADRAGTPAAALAACAAAAEAAAETDPTDFACDWAAAKAPGALTGRYAPAAAGVTGALSLIERGDGPALAQLSIAAEGSLHTCTFSLAGARDGPDLAFADPEFPGCTVRAAQAGDGGVTLTGVGDCGVYCGMRLTIDGPYASAP